MVTRLTRNPWFIFSPFLFYYGYLIFKNKRPALYGDEVRYVEFAKNLTHGFYSPYPHQISLWNGPGFPLLLAPFVALHVPSFYITLMNALYQYLAVVFLFKAVKLTTYFKPALLCAMLLAIYPNALSMLPILYTEAFSTFLVSFFIYAVTLYYYRGLFKYTIIAGIVLGFLTLTKIIFGYVLLAGLAFCLVLLMFNKKKRGSLSSVKIMLLAFLVTTPYLTYTCYITGKVFYWGNSGGMSLYWMSSPYEHEYGDWKHPNLNNNQYPYLFKSTEGTALLKKNHSAEIKAIISYDKIKQDDRFKQKAISNILNHPARFAENYCYNFSRMLFNFPYSYAYQDAAIIKNILIGSLILWGALAGIVVSFINWRGIIFPLKLGAIDKRPVPAVERCP